MRLLFTMDTGDYDPRGPVFVRHSARCVTIRDGRVAMVHSLKYDYYKFPGGGIEPGESPEQAMLRETLEEAGLVVLPGTVRAYGCVHRAQKGDQPGQGCFVQDNFYYLCETEPRAAAQRLDTYEAEASFTLEWVEPERAIQVNRYRDHGATDQIMLEREARVLEILMQEGIL